MNDEMMRQWEEVSKDEEEITVKRGGKFQVEKVQSAPEPGCCANLNEEKGCRHGEEEEG